jgi:hypothetical protein
MGDVWVWCELFGWWALFVGDALWWLQRDFPKMSNLRSTSDLPSPSPTRQPSTAMEPMEPLVATKGKLTQLR